MADPKPVTTGEAIRTEVFFANLVKRAGLEPGEFEYAKGWDDCLAFVHEIIDRTEKNS